MAKKDSGLGRGLGDLLFDNTPEIRMGGSVIKRDGNREITVNHGESSINPTVSVVKNAGNYTEQTSIPQVFATVEPINAKNESVTAEQLSIETVEPTVIIANGASGDEDTPAAPKRSLKALFREYK